MAGINRVGSPMDLFDDTFEQSKEKMEQKRRSLELKHRTNSPFLIGSIEEVNKKISKLDRKLQQYTQLIVESRASDYPEDEELSQPPSGRGREIIEQKEREQRELNKFAGYFTLKQTFLPGRSERVRNISKISSHPSKVAVVKKDSGKPKFVELHQYPGYDPAELTSLPDDIPAREMMEKAAEAEMDLEKKPHYEPVFKKLFYSPMSQAVFQDMFWYFFLERYQSSKNAQVKLFNRAAFNYVKLMLYVKSPYYRDVFFKDYPSLISQAIYAAYCHCFPDSYRQFGEDFKEDLLAMVYGWIAGIKPAPRIWLHWNFDKLEPPNIKMREEILNQNNKKTPSIVNFDFLDSLISSNISRYASTTSLSQSASNASATSAVGKRQRKALQRRSGGGASRRSVASKVASSSSSSSHDDTMSESSATTSRKPSGQKSAKAVDPRKLVEALTPIRETTFEEDIDYSEMGRKSVAPSEQAIKVMGGSKPGRRSPRESLPACKGPDTVKSVFNIYGQSPLVAHFLRMKCLDREAGQVFLIQRTEQENLPPLDAPTYRDVMRESYRKVKEAERSYQVLYDNSVKESIAFSRRQKAMLKEHMRKQAALLGKPKEVKRLSDLLILEFTKDPDSISAGAKPALIAALEAQD